MRTQKKAGWRARNAGKFIKWKIDSVLCTFIEEVSMETKLTLSYTVRFYGTLKYKITPLLKSCHNRTNLI
ncbi:Contactin-Associated Protein-Like 4 [Manis pentadactyla]|nr:Contactin-Associated Protein-Like 4 [Manis pentadactyla]